MAVVIHGSFDEGPIVLALPPIYEFAPNTETDPIFSAWNRSSGITINSSQISDSGIFLTDNDLDSLPDIVSTGNITSLGDLIVGDDLVVTGDATIGGTITASNLSGNNTGDQDISNFVPYTGATESVDLGSFNLYANKAYTTDNNPVSTNELVSKGWVEALLGNGIFLQASVRGFRTDYADLPGSPMDGDRWITTDTESIWEYETSVWVEHVPEAGWQVWSIEDTSTYTFDGVTWRNMIGVVNHNDTLNKEGGFGGHWYHLGASEHSAVIISIDDTNIADVTGLTLVDSGISIVAGHQAAWVELGWDASPESSFDHYIVYYKQHDLVLWAEVVASVNSIRIEGLIPGTSYDFTVSAVTKAGNVTSKSATLVVFTNLDTEGPGTVSGLVATGAIQAVLLRWTHNTDADLSHYHVYRNTTNDSGTATNIANFKGNAFMDNGPVVVGTIGLAVDTEYFYWLKAVDISGNESDTFSTVASATTRNIIASDIVNIGANQVIIQGLTTVASLFSPGVTTIDGDKITTDTITLEKIVFTSNGGIVANINANAEGVQLDTAVFNITGATIFTAKEGGQYVSSTNPATLSRISIYPNTDIGLEITDDLGNNVLKAEIGGTNIGDLTIGDYTNNQGILYDKSAGVTTFKGTIYAYDGQIANILSFGTAAEQFNGTDSNISIQGNKIWENTYVGDTSTVAINYWGYNGGNSYYRDFSIYDGKGSELVFVDGSNRHMDVRNILTITGDAITGGYIKLPVVTTTQRNALPKAYGMMVYDSTVGTICIIVNIGGTPTWFKVNSQPIP